MLIFENTNVNLTMPVSEHFKLVELKCRCKKCNLTFLDERLLSSLEILRNFWNKPITNNSCYRCQEHNRSVGGSKLSYHMRGLAIDLPLPAKLGEWPEFIFICKKIFTFTKLSDKQKFIHCDCRQTS